MSADKRHVGHARHAERLAIVQAFQLRQLVQMLQDQIADLVNDAAARRWRHAAPGAFKSAPARRFAPRHRYRRRRLRPPMPAAFRWRDRRHQRIFRISPATHLPSISMGRGLPSQFFSEAGTRSSVELVRLDVHLGLPVFPASLRGRPGPNASRNGASGFGAVSARNAWIIRVPWARFAGTGAAMTRIFLAGIFHETHCFTGDITGMDGFRHPSRPGATGAAR